MPAVEIGELGRDGDAGGPGEAERDKRDGETAAPDELPVAPAGWA
jgi:hypothetical protein